jgi:hypothetical protein
MTPAEIAARLTKKQKTLLYLAGGSGGGMYHGTHWCRRCIPLGEMGLVYEDHPHNPVHKPRAVATPLGREVRAIIEKEDGK